MDLSLIQGTISGLKTAGEIAKGLLELKSIADVQGKVIELQSAILEAQSCALSATADQTAMAQEIRTLREEIDQIKAWNTERQRYKLMQPWSAGVVYGLKESMSNAEPPHLLCTNCYEGGRKTILNPTADAHGWVAYACPVCKSQIPTGYRGSVTPSYASE